jgi:hypothetical protein
MPEERAKAIEGDCFHSPDIVAKTRRAPMIMAGKPHVVESAFDSPGDSADCSGRMRILKRLSTGTC